MPCQGRYDQRPLARLFELRYKGFDPVVEFLTAAKAGTVQFFEDGFDSLFRLSALRAGIDSVEVALLF